MGRGLAAVAACFALLAATVPVRAEAGVDLVRQALQPRGELPVRWPRRPLLGRVAELARVSVARRELGVTGRGATVCVVDTGIDLEHPDFLDADGRTRVRWLLDLDGEPRGVHADLERELGGAVWGDEEIDGARAAGEALPRDWNGHGTAVASVAAGDDAGVGAEGAGPLAGIAPEAALVVARVLRRGEPGVFDADMVTGVRFCTLVAGRGSRPTEARRTVTVLSVGGHDGAHDGTDPVEEALNELAREGALVVVPAGNDGGREIHASGSLYAGERVSVPLDVPSPRGAPGSRHVAVVVTTAASEPVAVALRAPDGTRTDWVQARDAAALDHSGGRLTATGEVPSRGALHVIYGVMSGTAERPMAGGRYHLELRGPGRFDAWIAGTDLGASPFRARFGGAFADRAETVVVPATADGVVTVGELVSRASLDGPPGEPAVAESSARGPAAHGAPKPDLVAPGGWLAAALSGDLAPGDPANMLGGSAGLLERLRAGQGRVAVRGTSFAAPVVAGALALALELAPSGGRRDRALLMGTARALSDRAWTPEGGAGVLDVARFLEARAAVGPGGVPSAATSAAVLTRGAGAPGARDVWLFARVRDEAGLPVDGSLEVVPSGGRPFEMPVRAGIARAPVPVPTEAFGSTVVYDARVGDVQVGTLSLVLHVDEARATVGEPGGGGCRVEPSPRAPDPLPSLVLALVVGRLIRRRR